MKLECHPTPEDVAARAADLVAAVVRAKPEAVLVVPAGSTPVPLFAELVRRQTEGGLDLARAHFFQLDELLGVDTRDERGFHDFLRRTLIEPLSRGDGRDHLLDGGAEDPAAEIAAHCRELEALGGADLVLLGIGRNSHVAFNEPGTRRDEGGRVVALDQVTVAGLRRVFDESRTPRRGMTLGLREIAASKRIVLIATGATKAEVLAALVHDEPSPDRPASLLIGHPDLLVLADEDAARLLDPLEI